MNTREEFRIAVIGAGRLAENYHLPSLQRMAEADASLKLVALCDIHAERGKSLAARFGFANYYQDYHALAAAETLDAVWLLLPTPVMKAAASFFLAQGVPSFIEKPPARNSAETRELAQLAAEHATPNQVAFNRRYAPLLRQMKELLRERGGFRSASCQFFRVARRDPDFTYTTGLHGLDTLRFLGGSEVCEVRTEIVRDTNRLATLYFQNGAWAHIEILPMMGVQSERYTAHADDRTVIADGAVAWLTHFPGFLNCFDGGNLTLAINNEDRSQPEVVSGFFGESAAFIGALRNHTSPTPDLSASIRSLEIAETIERGENVIFPN